LPDSTQPTPVRTRRLELYLLLGALTAFAPLTTDIYLPAMPVLQHDFATSASSVQLTLSTYFLGFALGQSFWGPIADRYGRRPPLFIGLTLYAVASAICTLAPTIEWVAAARFVQAIGACAGIVIARAVVADLFAAQEAARAFAMLTMVMGAAPIVAPSVGAYLLIWFGWRAIFWLLVIFGVTSMTVAWFRLPETRPAGTTGPAAIGQVLTRYYQIATDRRFLAYGPVGALAMSGMYAYLAGGAFVFEGRYGWAPDKFALLFGLNSLAIIGGAQVNRFLLRTRPALVVLRRAVMATCGTGLLLLASALAGPDRAWAIAVPLFCCIGTLGFVYPNATALTMGSFRHQAGFASALLGTIQSSLAAFTAILIGAIGGTTALPMAIVIAAYTMLSFALSRLIRPPAPEG
jgi:DHA1 family bicyclomycin/chloramphenicol resistance-like MFS transporter